MDKNIQVYVDTEGGCDWSNLRYRVGVTQEVIHRFSEWACKQGAEDCVTLFQRTCPSAWQEAVEVAAITDIAPERILAANVFYDGVRAHCGCTAFAMEGEDGPIHGHCLDWDYGAETLRRNNAIFRFIDENGIVVFRSVGWPGFLGAFVGVAPGRFAITLNAVWSEDEPTGGRPIGFVLREALAKMRSYEEAVDFLSTSSIHCDCILLVSGTKEGEIAVIERTPSRCAVRRACSEFLVATNHYSVIQAGSNKPGYLPSGQEPFGEGSRERYACALSKLAQHLPKTVESCFSLLAEEPFCHATTIQRVAMRASTGQLLASRTGVGTGESDVRIRRD